MFFLLRMAFWLGLVCVLLPSGGTKTSPDAQVNAGEAVTLASAAVSDMRGFCDRQPAACKAGGKVAVALGQKAEAGARRIFEFVTAKMSEPPAQKAAGAKPAASKPEATVETVSSIAHGTLKASDLTPAWHGRVPLPPRRYVPPSGRPSV